MLTQRGPYTRRRMPVTSPPAFLTARQALVRAAPLLLLRPLMVVSDFDGTLAHLQLDPWAARIVPAAQRALRRLATIDGVHVALMSGRQSRDLAERARVGGIEYLGNHSLERGTLARRARAATLTVRRDEVPEQYGRMAEHLAFSVPALVPETWLVVERKAPAVAFHFRGAPDVDVAGGRVREAVERLDPDALLIRFPGRRVLELRPPGAPAKGEGMRSLLDRHRPAAAFMLGDDRSDAEAFRILTAARSTGETTGLAIAIQARAEVAEEVLTAADVVLASPADTARFLGGLARSLMTPP
jgi:trehalose 6-phosphate phosphatase